MADSSSNEDENDSRERLRTEQQWKTVLAKFGTVGIVCCAKY